MLRPAIILWLTLYALACSGDDASPGQWSGDGDARFAGDGGALPTGDGDGDVNEPVTPPVDPCAATAQLPGVCPIRGLYDGVQVIEVTAPIGAADAPLHYTLDGSEPTEASPRYTGPVAIDGNAGRAVVMLRVRALPTGPTGVAPGAIATHSYVFPAHVVDQPAQPAGFPDRWGNADTRDGDYAMDPRVIDPARADAVAGLRALPTVSIVAPPDALFGQQDGIYMNPEREGVEWERTVSAELLPSAATGPGFQVDAGLRIQGGSSTQDWKAAKLSMRLLFKAEHGVTRLSYPLFADSTVTRFNTLVLDAHLNLSYVHPDHDQRVRSQFVRDAYVADLCNAAGAVAPHAIFVHLYLNGLYWGLYELHERPDDAFAADYLGGSRPDYDVLKHAADNVVEGDGVAFGQLLDLARAGLDDPARYAELPRLLHIPSFIDYMLVNLYAGNTDWPRHNWYAARNRMGPVSLDTTDDTAGFHFFSWDAEHVLKDERDNVFDVNEGPGAIFQALLDQPDFRARFDARARQHLAPGGLFHVDPANPAAGRPAALYQKRIDEVRPAVVLESARWGDNRRDQPYGVVEFDAELDWLMQEYFPQRSAVFEGQLPGM